MHDMKRKNLFTVSLATAIVALSTSPVWGGNVTDI